MILISMGNFELKTVIYPRFNQLQNDDSKLQNHIEIFCAHKTQMNKIQLKGKMLLNCVQYNIINSHGYQTFGTKYEHFITHV